MSQKFNSDFVSLYISRNTWRHPNGDIYYFTGGILGELTIRTDYLILHVMNRNEFLFYKVKDKIVDNETRPFIEIGNDEYAVLSLSFGTNNDQLVIKWLNDLEIVFSSYSN